MALKQGSLLIKLPFIVLQRRLYSKHIYHKETENSRGLVNCLKGMLIEEGIGHFRGFWYYWVYENF